MGLVLAGHDGQRMKFCEWRCRSPIVGLAEIVERMPCATSIHSARQVPVMRSKLSGTLLTILQCP
jgi:hypothetical protein